MINLWVTASTDPHIWVGCDLDASGVHLELPRSCIRIEIGMLPSAFFKGPNWLLDEWDKWRNSVSCRNGVWVLSVRPGLPGHLSVPLFRVFTKSLFSQPVFQYKHFLYKISSLLKLSLKNICRKYCRWPPRIFFYGKSGLKKRDQ